MHGMEQPTDSKISYVHKIVSKTHIIDAYDEFNDDVGTIIYEPTGYISYIIVDEKCRRKGIGKSLINEAIKDIRNYASLVTLDSTIKAFPFYKKLGFLINWSDLPNINPQDRPAAEALFEQLSLEEKGSKTIVEFVPMIKYLNK
jgi:GNAT superfamily N-acetyltransferase